MEGQRGVFVLGTSDRRSTHKLVLVNERTVDVVGVGNHSCGSVVAAYIGGHADTHVQPHRALNVEAAQVCARNQSRAGVEVGRGKTAIDIVLIPIIQRLQGLILEGGCFGDGLRRRNHLCVWRSCPYSRNSHSKGRPRSPTSVQQHQLPSTKPPQIPHHGLIPKIHCTSLPVRRRCPAQELLMTLCPTQSDRQQYRNQSRRACPACPGVPWEPVEGDD